MIFFARNVHEEDTSFKLTKPNFNKIQKYDWVQRNQMKYSILCVFQLWMNLILGSGQEN